MTTVRLAADIASELILSPTVDGVTVPAIVGQRVPTTGYAVGGRVPSAFGSAEAFVRRNLATAAFHGAFFGAWRGPWDVMFDVVDVIAERQTAVEIGRARGEYSIFDFANLTEIVL